LRVDRVWLQDFRNYRSAEADLDGTGLTVIMGLNGEGKTNFLEAIGWLATLESFRHVPTSALLRWGATSAVVRADGERAGRRVLIETELGVSGRVKAQVNRQPLRRSRDLLGVLRATIFSPDDLVLIKGGPQARRNYLDELLVAWEPRWDAVRAEVERVLRQRTTLLKQASGRLSTAVASTLDVWDAKLASAGSELARGRARLVDRLTGRLTAAYGRLVPGSATVELAYVRSWAAEPDLAVALAASRRDDLRLGACTVGPHRDDLLITVSGLPARTHGSQGEQRSLALALRLAGHEVVTEAVGEPPLLLFDDVFSELDPKRCAALAAHLPPGQALLTTAGSLPAGLSPAAVFHVSGGVITR